MELIRTLREKAQTKQVEDFNNMAEELITLSDFDGNIYIAFHNAPLILIDASWTTKQVEDFNKMAEEFINLSDFEGSIYIAFHNVPLIPINTSWTTKEILEELSKIRNNFVNAKIKKVC